MNYRRTRVSDGRPNVSNDFCHRLPQNEPQFRFDPLLHYQTLQRPYMLNNSLPSTTNRSARLLEWMTRIAPVSTHIPPISLVYSSPVIVDVPSDSVPLDLTMSRHSYYMPQHSLCEAAIDMSVVAGRGISSMQRGENLSYAQRSLTSDVMLEALPSGGSEEFIPSGRGKRSRGSRCGGNTRAGRKRGSKNQQKTPQKQQTTRAGSCLSPTRTMEAVAGLLMLPESSSPGSTAVSGGAGEAASTPKRPKTPRKSRKPTNYRPIDYLTQSRNCVEETPAAAAATTDFATNTSYGHAATGLEGETISLGTAVTFESTLSQFCRLLESGCCSTTSTGSVSTQNSLPVASCATVTATETQTSPARSSARPPPVPLRAERSPRSSESKATETLVSTSENGCQTDDDLGAVCLDCIRNPSLSNSSWTTKEMEVDCASGLRSPLPSDVDFSGEVGSLLPSLNLPQMKDLIQRLQWRVQMLEQQAMGDGSSAGHLLHSDSSGSSEPLFDSTAVVASGEPERSPPHELSESEESLHLRLSESDDFVDLEQQQLLDSCHRSPDHLPSAVDSAAPVDAESSEKSRDFALSGKIGDLKRRLKAIENRFISAETCDEERNPDDVFPGDFDSVGYETDGGGISVASCRHDSEKQNLSTMSPASHLAEYVVCTDAGMMMIRPLEADDYEFPLGSATVTPHQNSELSTVMDQMASLDIAEGNEVLSNYQSRLQLEAISPPSSVISLRDDETGDMDLNLEDNDNTFIAHGSETNELLEGISDVVKSDDRSVQSNCREIVNITVSIPIAETESFSDSILLSSGVTCASDDIHLGNIVSAESNTHDNISDGASVDNSSSLRVDAADNTCAYIGTCDVSDIVPDIPDEVNEVDDRSHEMHVEVDDVDDTQDEGTEQRDSAEEKENPTDANAESSENELPFSCCVQSVALLSDSSESGVGATETTHHAADDAHDANDRLTVDTFSEEVTVDANRPPLPLEGHHKERKPVSDLSSGAYKTLFDARVVIERLDMDAFLEMKTKVKDYKPVVAQWLHRPRRPRHRCRKTKIKGKSIMHRPLHCDHNYVVQPASDRRSTIADSRDVPKDILQNVDVVSEQQSNDMSTSVEPHDVTPHDVTPHDVELVTTFPLSFNSGLCRTDVDYFATAVLGSDLEPRLHEDDSTVRENSVDDVDAEVEISFTSNNEVFPEEDSQRDYECADSYSARCSESSVAMAVVNGVAASVDDGRQAPKREPSVVADCAGATFGNGVKSILDILDADAVESDDLTGSSTVFVCTDEPGTSNVPTATDSGIDKAVKNLRMISQMVKKSSTAGGGESGACDDPQETATHFPSYLEDKKASKEARFRQLPVQSLVLDSSEIRTAEELLNVAGTDGKENALEHNGEVETDGSGEVLLPGAGKVGCLDRTGEAQNSDQPREETDAVCGNPSAADGEQRNTPDHPDHMISSGDHSANDSIVASQNAPRKRGRKPKASQPCSASRDITASPHGAGKAFDRCGVSASESVQGKRRRRPPRSFDDDQSPTRPEKATKYDAASQAVETGQDTAPVFLLVKGHRTPKRHGRNLFSEINPSNVLSGEEKSSPSSVCLDFSLRNSSETKRPIRGRTGRPPRHRRRSGDDDDDQDAKQEQRSPRKTSTNGSKTSEINRRKHKTRDSLQSQRASNRSGDEDQRYTREEIPLLKTVNSTGEVVIRKMYVNICRGKASMVVDVISKAPSGAARLAQCLFCEFLAPSIQDVGKHLDDCHSEFVLVISKARSSQESSTRYFCRHCQFVTVDHTVMWIHFEMSHNVRGILTSENRVDPVLLGGDGDREPEVRPLSLDRLVHFDRVYMCPECGSLIENRTTMISHVVRRHTTENYCNGNFIKSIALSKPRNLPEQPTYRSLVMDDAFGVYRKPCYICVFCQFVVFEACLALSHFICFHVKKKLLMVCMKDSCGRRFVKERRFYEHVKQRHDGLDIGAYFDCSVTLLEEEEDTGEIAEVVLPSVHDGQPLSRSQS